MKKEILVVEDDEMLNAGLCYNLELEGFLAAPVHTIQAAKLKIAEKSWDTVLLDVNLPDGNGFEFSRFIRQKTNAPIIFLTACDLDDQIIEGFELGADDYITKPFNIKIVMQRIKAILRRSEKTAKELCTYGNLHIDFDSRTASKSGEVLVLTPTEFKLLHLFCSHTGQVLTRRTLLEKLWDNDGNFVDEHTLTINISRLRSKIADDEYAYIKTIYGMGYQWTGEKDA